MTYQITAWVYRTQIIYENQFIFAASYLGSGLLMGVGFNGTDFMMFDPNSSWNYVGGTS